MVDKLYKHWKNEILLAKR